MQTTFRRYMDEEADARDRERTNRILTLCRQQTPEASAEARRLMQEGFDERQARIDRINNEKKLACIAEKQRAEAQKVATEKLLKGQVLNYRGDFRTTNLYRKSQVIFDLTFLFVEKYIPTHGDRTRDQMIQAARSGKQNFVEGWEDGTSSDEFLLGLFSVGKGSLQELKEDYEDYLRTRSLPQWDKSHPRYAGLVEFCKTRNEVEQYREVWQKMNDEELANMALTLLHQTDRMAQNFIKHLEHEVLAGQSTTVVRSEIQAAAKQARRGY